VRLTGQAVKIRDSIRTNCDSFDAALSESIKHRLRPRDSANAPQLADVLRACCKYRTEANIVRTTGDGSPNMLDCRARHADYRTRRQEPAGVGERHVRLADVHAVGPGCERDVNAIIYQDGDVVAPANRDSLPCDGEELV
jgi:hypothetical protein